MSTPDVEWTGLWFLAFCLLGAASGGLASYGQDLASQLVAMATLGALVAMVRSAVRDHRGDDESESR